MKFGGGGLFEAALCEKEGDLARFFLGEGLVFSLLFFSVVISGAVVVSVVVASIVVAAVFCSWRCGWKTCFLFFW